MKKARKIKLSKFTVAKVSFLTLKGGRATDDCESDVCLYASDECNSIDVCTGTAQTRTTDSLG